ncbi:MAG: hypothetical protein WCL48_01885 [Betaproteobacteria bacterium]
MLSIFRHGDTTQHVKATVALNHTSRVKSELKGDVHSPGAWDQSLI